MADANPALVDAMDEKDPIEYHPQPEDMVILEGLYRDFPTVDRSVVVREYGKAVAAKHVGRARKALQKLVIDQEQQPPPEAKPAFVAGTAGSVGTAGTDEKAAFAFGATKESKEAKVGTRNDPSLLVFVGLI